MIDVGDFVWIDAAWLDDMGYPIEIVMEPHEVIIATRTHVAVSVGSAPALDGVLVPREACHPASAH